MERGTAGHTCAMAYRSTRTHMCSGQRSPGHTCAMACRSLGHICTETHWRPWPTHGTTWKSRLAGGAGSKAGAGQGRAVGSGISSAGSSHIRKDNQLCWGPSFDVSCTPNTGRNIRNRMCSSLWARGPAGHGQEHLYWRDNPLTTPRAPALCFPGLL